MKQKILLILAHPDDETFAMGGTIAKYVDSGSQVDLICVTRGQAGERGPYDETVDVGAIRTQELEDAADVLGISSVRFWEYKDGKLDKVNPGELEDLIHKVLVAEAPTIVMTYEPNGISNHPDHKRVCISTTYAFQKYAKTQVHGETLGTRDPRRKFVGSLPASSSEPKLYYACMPDSVAEFLKKNKVIPGESFGKPWIGVADKKVTTCIDISDYTERKMEALSKHKTQIADVERFISIDNQPLMYKEYFIFRMHGEQEIFMGKDDEVSEEL